MITLPPASGVSVTVRACNVLPAGLNTAAVLELLLYQPRMAQSSALMAISSSC